MSKLLVGLNPEQVAVVLHDKGPLRVIAVAGSGKTRSLVHRVAYLVEERGVDPGRILAVTFTKKAAEEMNARLRRLLSKTRARVGTFHSLAFEILCSEGPAWSVDDEGHQYRKLVTAVVGYQQMDWTGADLGAVLDYIAQCKANVELPGSDEARERARGWGSSRLHEAYTLAEEQRKSARFWTYDDYLVGAVLLLEDPEREWGWTRKYEYVLQDEAMDVNPAQARMMLALAKEHGNYMVVGDLAQCVYKFRGADPRSLLEFESDWPGTTDVVMHRNYRSAEGIIAIANRLLSAMGAGYMITPVRPHAGQVLLRVYEDQLEEAKGVVERMREIRHDGVAWSTMCVLYRMHTQSRALEDILLQAQIPYVVAAGGTFYRRKEVVGLLAYLRTLVPDSSWADVAPSLRSPYRYLSRALLSRCEQAVSETELPVVWEEVLPAAVRGEPKGREVLRWAVVIAALRKMASEGKPPGALLRRVIDDTGYIRDLVRENGAEGPENPHVSNVRDLLSLADKHGTVESLLAHVDTMSDKAVQARAGSGDRVRLSTVHAAKGCEWEHAWVISCNEGVMPQANCLENKDDLAEERRLAYVAFTRAKDELQISWVRRAVASATLPAKPSRFLQEVGLVGPDEDVESGDEDED